MAFLHSCKGNALSGGATSSAKTYVVAVDNTSFQADGGEFKARITHNLDTNNLIAQVNKAGSVQVARHKYIDPNTVDIYYSEATDVTVTILGFNKTSSGASSVIGLGIIGEIVLGER